ncbi:MAG TPA: hypothetical protein VGM56_09790 [Byssovorax sp.]
MSVEDADAVVVKPRAAMAMAVKGFDADLEATPPFVRRSAPLR